MILFLIGIVVGMLLGIAAVALAASNGKDKDR